MLSSLRFTTRLSSSTIAWTASLSSSSSYRHRCLTTSYSRILDLGGAPSSLNDANSTTRIHDASKNCKLQAVCFDFEVLTKYTPKQQDDDKTNETRNNDATSVKLETKATPNATMVQQVADLLNVNLGKSSGALPTKKEPEDDLSLLTGQPQEQQQALQKGNDNKGISNSNPLLSGDIRAKYADKLAKRGLQGGLAQVQLAKHEMEQTLQRGDAAGHVVARQMAAADNPSSRQSWMALTGTGALLQYLTQRSIAIVLLPRPTTTTDKTVNDDERQQGQGMQDLERQLKNVVFSHLIKDGRPGAVNLVQTALEKLKLDPHVVLVVSDRDNYLRAAKEASMMTCRILPPNARRGNISAHFMVESIPEVQDVVNEINGISYNAVFKSR